MEVNSDSDLTNRPRGYQSLRRMAIAAALLITTACTQLDPYAEKFPHIAIGDGRASVIEMLGEPTSVNSIEAPFVKLEQLTWRSRMSGRVYVVNTALGRVVTKYVY